MLKIDIIGAGLVGRVVALTLLQRHADIQLTLIDSSPSLYDKKSCGYKAAGMVAPICELELGEPMLYAQGKKSVQLWKLLADFLGNADLFNPQGTIVLAHQRDSADFEHFAGRLSTHIGERSPSMVCSTKQLEVIEPHLQADRFYSKMMRVEEEGAVNVPLFYQLSADYLMRHPQVSFKNECLTRLEEGLCSSVAYRIDTRGLGAKQQWQGLRGVRGESMVVHAPEVQLNHVVRLIHPRYPLYVVPRGNGVYYIGATTIQSEDDSPISVVSSLELLSALYTLHSGFAEARVLKTLTGVRPSLATGLPELKQKGPLIMLNGFYRHGYLLAPVYAQQIVESIFSEILTHEG